MNEQYLDLTNLQCPLPILRAKKALAKMESGTCLRVDASDKGAPTDFVAFCRQTGHILHKNIVLEDGTFQFLIECK